MKKLLILVAFAFVATTINAQMSSPGVDRIAAQDLEIMEVKISSKYPNLAFNPAQKEKLSAVLTQRAEEVHVIRSQESITKDEFSIAYKAIEKKYQEKILALLTPEQKIVYNKKKSQMQRGI